MKTIYFAVTNELLYDQRMIRICSSLALEQYNVVLIGRSHSASLPLQEQPFMQVRLRCLFKKGKLMYLEFNIRLLFFLLFRKMDAICAIDLDTILPCYMISLLKKIPRVYDAHELFTEMKEVTTRPFVKKFWLFIERLSVPAFTRGYTVSGSIAAHFKKWYGVQYELIRNMPCKTELKAMQQNTAIILYQGAINEARGLELLIPAMRFVKGELHLYGNGNFEKKVIDLIQLHKLSDKIFLHAPVLPETLRKITAEARIGINLVEYTGLNQYYSLANKFFDYIQSGIPQVTMKYPEYENINNNYEVALLLNELNETTIARAINRLLTDELLYNKLQQNCYLAREMYNWEEEEKKLISFYRKIWE